MPTGTLDAIGSAVLDTAANTNQPPGPAYGGKYSALEHPDGTYTILGVPIFGEVEKGANGNTFAVKGEDLKAAFAKASARQEKGFAIPLHLRHHSCFGDEGVEYAGKVVLRALRLEQYEGGAILAVIADFVGMPFTVFERVRRGEYSYASVEYWDDSEPDLTSCALMSTECPFFRFPCITVGTVTKTDQPVKFEVYKAAARADRALAVFALQPKQPPAKTAPPPAGGTAQDPAAADGAPDPEADAGGGMAELLRLVTEIHAAVVQPALQQKAKNPVPAEQPQDQTQKNQQQPADQKKPAAFQAQPPSTEEIVSDKKNEPAATPAAAPADFDAMIKMAAERDAATDKTAALEFEKSIDTKVAEAQAELKKTHPIGPKTIESLRAFARMGDKALAQYLAHYRSTVVPNPPKSEAQVTDGKPAPAPTDAAATAAGADPLAKFAASPAERARVEHYRKEYAQCKAHLDGMSEERFVELALAREKKLVAQAAAAKGGK